MSLDPDRFLVADDSGGGVDWVAWHGAYDSPTSSLAARLGVVRHRLDEVLSRLPADASLLSLCAGDGRDVLGVRSDRPDWTGRALLVERDPDRAGRARVAAETLDGVVVRCGDAADRSVYADVLSVDIVMICGVFGNVEPTEVDGIVLRVGSLLADGGQVIWTRGGGPPDRRPEVRAAFLRGGFEEVSFDGAPQRFGVGVSRLSEPPAATWDGTEPLFRFVR